MNWQNQLVPCAGEGCNRSVKIRKKEVSDGMIRTGKGVLCEHCFKATRPPGSMAPVAILEW